MAEAGPLGFVVADTVYSPHTYGTIPDSSTNSMLALLSEGLADPFQISQLSIHAGTNYAAAYLDSMSFIANTLGLTDFRIAETYLNRTDPPKALIRFAESRTFHMSSKPPPA